jgi:hypothetical protein
MDSCLLAFSRLQLEDHQKTCSMNNILVDELQQQKLAALSPIFRLSD